MFIAIDGNEMQSGERKIHLTNEIYCKEMCDVVEQAENETTERARALRSHEYVSQHTL